MEEWQRLYILKHFPRLIESIQCNTQLLTNLEQSGALAIGDMANLNAAKFSDGVLSQSRRLLDMLKTRKNGYNKLAAALYECKQSEAFLILLQGLAKNTSGNPLESFGIDISDTNLINYVVSFDGHNLALNRILKPDKYDTSGILRKCMDITFFRSVYEETTATLTRNTIPKTVPFYISRSLTMANQLRMDFFKKLSPDIFLIESIEKYELTKLAQDIIQPSPISVMVGFETLTDSSGRQRQNPTVRFILLERKQHFEEISEKTCYAVHWIKYKDGNYFLLRSNGKREFGELKAFLQQSHQNIPQDELLSSEFQSENCPVLIYDTPGMGKSMLLANIAESLKMQNPDRHVIFLEMKDLLAELSEYDATMNIEALEEALIKKVTTCNFGKRLLAEIYKHPGNHTDLFLDGFDEVAFEYKQIAINILSLINKSGKKFRLYITSRPHKGEELENILGVLGYHIVPFNESIQISLFEKFWKYEHKIVLTENVHKYAESCLSQINSKMLYGDLDITGIPLQCRMLAEIFAEEVRNEEEMLQDFDGTIKSIYQVYKRYIETKFNLVLKSERDEVMDAHIRAALMAIFPEQFSFQIPQQVCESMCKIGVVVMCPGNTLNFIHRTYAEYFVVELILKILSGQRSYIISIEQFLDLLFDKILNDFTEQSLITHNGVDYSWFTYRSFQYPVIVSFLNFGILEINLNIDLNSIQEFFKTRGYFSQEKFFTFLWCCLSHNLLHLSGLISILFCQIQDNQHVQIPGSVISSTETFQMNVDNLDQSIIYPFTNTFEFWEEAVLTSAQFAGAELAHRFCLLVCSFTMLNISDLNYPGYITPLHVAVRRGSYNIVELFFNIYKDKMMTLNYLLHECLFQSSAQLANIINDKIQILKLVVENYPELINKACQITRITPIHTENTHFDLIRFLINQGADVEQKVKMQNFTHTVAKYFSPSDYHRFVQFMVLKNLGEMFGYTDESGNTPVHLALLNIDLETETLELLNSECSVSFNSKNGNGDSELFASIQGMRCVRVLQDIVRLGGNFHARNFKSHNALCFSLQANNLEALRYFLSLKVPLNQRCLSYTKSIFYHVLECNEHVRKDALRLLVDHQGDVNSIILKGYTIPYPDPVSRWDNLCPFRTPLSFAALTEADPETIDILMEAGANKYSIASVLCNIFLFICVFMPTLPILLIVTPIIIIITMENALFKYMGVRESRQAVCLAYVWYIKFIFCFYIFLILHTKFETTEIDLFGEYLRDYRYVILSINLWIVVSLNLLNILLSL